MAGDREGGTPGAGWVARSWAFLPTHACAAAHPSPCPAGLPCGGAFSRGVKRLSLWVGDAQHSGGLISEKIVFHTKERNARAFPLPELQNAGRQTRPLPGPPSSSPPSLGRRGGQGFANPAASSSATRLPPPEAETIGPFLSYLSPWRTGKAFSGKGSNKTSRTKTTNTMK